ncbi:MAG: hypothetical protein KDK70_41175, partial [Myxococcales bacterium]|nr:hypothetical protein [Myxococcales bacterium]
APGACSLRARAGRWARASALGLLLALGPSVAAEAAEIRTVARTIGEGYMVRLPGPEGALISRRRLVQYVNLGAFELLPPKRVDQARRDPDDGQLRVVGSLRLRHDFGTYVSRAGGASAPLLQSVDGRQIDLLYGYLEGNRLGGWVDLRAGRQFEMSGLDFYAFDGGWVRVRTPAHLAVEAFGGLQVDGSAVFGFPTFELDGTEGTGADRVSSPMVGAAVSVADVRFMDARMAYRRTSTPAALGEDRVDSDGTLGLRPGVDQELWSGSVALRLLDGKLSPYGAVRYNIGTDRVDDISAGVHWALTELHTVRAQYLRTIPAFDLDSIFNVFSVTPFEDLRLVYEVRPGPRWTIDARFQGRFFHDETTGVLGTEPEQARRFGGGGGAGAAYRRRRLGLRTDAFGLGGEGGLRAGASVDARTHVVYDRLALDTRGYLLYYRDELVPDRNGHSVALQVGTNLHLGHGIYFNVVAEEMFTPFYRGAFRTFGILSMDWAFRGGSR